MSNDLTAQIEALLAVVSEPIRTADIADLLDQDPERIKHATAQLKAQSEDRGLAVIETDGKLQLVTDSKFSDLIEKHRKQEVDSNLTKPQSEALAVIAYMSPATKPTIDFVRGVNSRAVLRNLSTRGLVKKQQDTYSLTQDALAHLGITDTSELPDFADTRDKLEDFAETSDLNQDTK